MAALRAWRAYGFPIAVFAVGLVSTLLVVLLMRKAADAQDLERFDNAADRLEDSIRDRFDRYVALLRGGVGAMTAGDLESADRFRAFVERLELRTQYPGVQGIGYAARIPADRVEDAVAEQRRQGRRDFTVWPVKPPTEDYYSILYLEPLDARNRAAIGYDMFGDPVRRAAMEAARDSGQPATSGIVTLQQEIDGDVQRGFLIYLPLYAGGTPPDSQEGRRRALRGFVYSPFRAVDLFEGILGSNTRPRAGFELYDGPSASASLLYRTGLEPATRRFADTRRIAIHGREWRAEFFSTRSLDESSSSAFLPQLVGAGSGVTVLLTTLAFLQTRARHRAETSEKLADEASRQVQQLLSSERAARAEAERVSRLKDEFLATLSHELRTPLNAVVGWGHMLHSGTLSPDKQRVAVETILRNARMQSQLIDDLLDMSRIISGRVGLELRLVDLGEIVGAAINVVRPTASAKHIEIDVKAGTRLYAVKGDGSRLQQIVWNLLSNAIKFTPQGGRVTVTLRQRDAQIELAVSDSGIGIDPAFLPYVFERFRQADGSLTRGHGGLGLGLSIVRSLVEMHAGTIQAESGGPDRGATFTVCLPAATDAELAEAGRDRPDAAGVPDAAALAGLSILVVDDEADAGNLAAEVLTQYGARVRVARSGAEALRLLHATEAPALIVSDLGMPQMDGYALIQRIRALPAAMGGTVPAIALTAYAGAGDRTRALAAGYDLHVAKPFTPADLVAACTRLLHTGTL